MDEYTEITPYRAGTKWFSRNRHYFVVSRTKGSIVYLRCASEKCPARWSIRNGEVGPIMDQHNHPPEDWIPDRNELFQALKRRAMSSETTALSTIYAQEAARYPKACRRLPFVSVAPSMRKWRSGSKFSSEATQSLTTTLVNNKETREVEFHDIDQPSSEIDDVETDTGEMEENSIADTDTVTMKIEDFTEQVGSKEQQNLQWLKNKLRTVWSEPQYCGLCLEMRGTFYPWTTEFAVNESCDSKPLRDIVSAVLNCDVEAYVSRDVICEQCVEKTIHCYTFIENTKNVFKVLNTCVNDLLSKVTDVTNEIDKYANSNIMIVCEYEDEVKECVDIITSGTNTILTDQPIKKLTTPFVDLRKEEEIVNKILKNNTKNKTKGPVIIATQSIVKHPRTKVVSKVLTPTSKIDSPTFSLKEGKLHITPLTTNAPSAPKYNTYKCNSCKSIFTSYRALKEHEKTFHNTTVYQCRFCSKKYNSQQYLDVHYVNNHSKSRCRHCRDLFDTKDLNDHLKEKHEKQVNICKYCDLVYYTAEQLETHFKSAHLINDVHSKKNETQCVMCLRNFRNVEIKTHKCKFSCLECLSMPCVHYSYLMSYREQILSHATKIRCLDCDFVTKRKEQLIAHVNREHLDHHPFTCDDCGTQFYTKLSMKTHIEQFHQDMKCQYCDHEFRNVKMLHQHRQICKKITRTFSCNVCVASFNTDEELQKHTNISHSDVVYPCTLCKKEFTNELTLKTHHARIHSGIQYKKRRKFIECTLCDVTFNNLKEMLQHEQLHDPSEKFPCKVCTQRFTSLKKMYLHKQQHYSRRLKCPSCDKHVVASYFAQHVAVCSTSGHSPNDCKICGKSFESLSELRAHKRFHMKLSPCQYCNKFIKPSSMRSHLQTKHRIVNDESVSKTSTKFIYKCDHCNYTSNKRHECENHVNKIHLKIKPYVCQVCSKAFCGKARLDEHVRTHSVDNNCFCTVCNSKFANKVCLKMHMRRHTGEKPYQCNICMERFRSSSIMKTHRLKKHQDKTIQCPLCDSMYHLVAEMRFHVKKVHWRRPEPFDFKEIIPEEYHHLFIDQRLQKLGET